VNSAGKRSPDHRLDPARHAEISARIIESELEGTRAVEEPTAIIIAGQPGAGKSGITAEALTDLERGGAVVVDVDAYRPEHPNYRALASSDDRTAASLVQHDASLWADELRDAAIASRRNLIIDGTLKSPDGAEELCRQLRRAGYRVELRALAVDRKTSLLGVHERYERSKAEQGWGRWVPESVHDEACRGVLQSVSRLERAGHADRVVVYGRQTDSRAPKILYDTDLRRNPEPSAFDAIRAERSRGRTAEERAILAARWAKVIEMIDKRNASPDEPEVRRAFELARRAGVPFTKRRKEPAALGAREIRELAPMKKTPPAKSPRRLT
jgi:predicted ABC-type ATPase